MSSLLFLFYRAKNSAILSRCLLETNNSVSPNLIKSFTPTIVILFVLTINEGSMNKNILLVNKSLQTESLKFFLSTPLRIILLLVKW